MKRNLVFLLVFSLLLAAFAFPLTAMADAGSITVNTGSIAGCSIGAVQNGSWVVSPATVAGNETSFNLPDNGKAYEIRISKGGMGITLYGRPGDTLTAPVDTLTLDTGVISGCTVGVVQSGAWVYTAAAITGNQTSFDVFDNGKDYELRVNKGGMGINLYGKAGADLTVPIQKLTVNTGDVSGCTVGVVQSGSWVYTAAAIAGNQTSFDVFDNGKDYEVRVNKGGMGITLYGKAGTTVTVPTYAVQIPSGLSNVGLVQSGSWVYQNIPSPGSIYVFRNGAVAELRYTENGKAVVQKFTLDGTITGRVTLRILFAGMNDIHVNVYNAAGVNLGWQGINRGQQEADYNNVAAGTYRVNLSKYGAVYEKTVTITAADVFTSPEWVLDTQPAAVTINYPGIGGANLSVKSKLNPGADVAYSQAPTQSTVYLFRNWTYTLAIAKAGVVYRQEFSLDDVPSLEIDVPLTKLKVINIMGVNGAGISVRYRLPGGQSDFQYMQTLQDGQVSASVFSDMDYEVIVSQYAIANPLYDKIVHVTPDGNGEYVIDLSKLEAAVTVDYTGLYYAPNVYLYDAAGKQIGYSQSADKSVFSLKRGKYTVALHKNGLVKQYPFEVTVQDAYSGSKTVTIPLINLTVIQPNGVNYACNINVIPANGSGNIAYSQSGAETVTGMKLFPDETYRIYFSGGMNFTDTFTVGKGDYTYTVPTATVTFDTAGITYGYGMNLYVTNASNNATAQYRQTVRDQRYPTTLIPGNTYTAKIYAGSTLLCTRTFTVGGDMTVHLFSALFIDTGIPGCSVGIVQNGSWVYTSRAISGTTACFAVPDNGKEYEVRISKGGMSITLYGKAYSDIAAPVKKLTVNTGSIAGCSVGVVQNNSWVYTASTVSGNRISFDVFDNNKTYEVRVSKGGMSITLYGKAGDTLTVPVGTLTVNTGSITGCSVGVVQNGSWVYPASAVAGNEATFEVFGSDKNYEVRVSKGGMSITLYGKAGDDLTVPIRTLRVSTGAITGCTIGVVQSDSWVYAPQAFAGSQAAFDVFDNNRAYEVRVSKGGMSITLYGEAGDDLTAPTYKINIPAGLKNVGLVQNGSWVYQNIPSPGQITVFANGQPAELRYTAGGQALKTTFRLNGSTILLRLWINLMCSIFR